ncbi:acyltransferase family protein [Macrococcus equi]|uniref:acyltransferase family protein n=1 Tax=Macrococcus equi TaxID=3395462 RepID=UPI0039BE8A55
MKKLKYIDSLRGFAILGVLLTHVTAAFPEIPSILYNIGHNGNKGVQLFFIVSALTLMISLNRNDEIHTKSFFIKRIFRIAPAYYSALLFYFIVSVIFNITGIQSAVAYNHSISNFIASITFTNMLHMNFLFSFVPGGWSVSNEFLFYLCLPLIFKKIKTLKSISMLTVFAFILGIISTLSGLYLYGFKSSLYIYYYYWFLNQFPIFCLGILLYFMLKHPQRINTTINFYKIKYLYLTLLILAFILFSSLTYISYLTYFNHYFFGIIFVLAIYYIAQLQPKVIVNNTTAFLGQISFSMYLIHFFYIDIFVHFFKLMGFYSKSNVLLLLILFILTLVATTLTAAFSYRYIEVPGINYGRKIINMQKNKVSPK